MITKRRRQPRHLYAELNKDKIAPAIKTAFDSQKNRSDGEKDFFVFRNAERKRIYDELDPEQQQEVEEAVEKDFEARNGVFKNDTLEGDTPTDNDLRNEEECRRKREEFVTV